MGPGIMVPLPVGVEILVMLALPTLIGAGTMLIANGKSSRSRGQRRWIAAGCAAVMLLSSVFVVVGRSWAAIDDFEPSEIASVERAAHDLCWVYPVPALIMGGCAVLAYARMRELLVLGGMSVAYGLGLIPFPDSTYSMGQLEALYGKPGVPLWHWMVTMGSLVLLVVAAGTCVYVAGRAVVRGFREAREQP